MKEMRNYYYSNNEKSIGPISFEQLRSLISSGQIQEQTLIWLEKSDLKPNAQTFEQSELTLENEKKAAIDIPELADFFENRHISDRLGMSLLNLLCCPPFGILGLILGIKINKWKALRDFDRAKKLSRWATLILICGFLFPITVFLILPAFSSAREAARRMQCTNNLKMIMLAMHNYHDQYQSFPPAFTTDENGQPLHSWRVLLLPFMEQQELYEKIKLNEPWDSDWNSQFHHINIPEFVCPSGYLYFCRDEKESLMKGLCFYSIIVSDQTAFPGKESRSFGDIKDGSSNTIALVERKLPICWMNPNGELSFQTALKGINQHLTEVGSFHSFGCNAAAFDGSVRFISNSINPDIWKALLTADGLDLSF